MFVDALHAQSSPASVASGTPCDGIHFTSVPSPCGAIGRCHSLPWTGQVRKNSTSARASSSGAGLHEQHIRSGQQRSIVFTAASLSAKLKGIDLRLRNCDEALEGGRQRVLHSCTIKASRRSTSLTAGWMSGTTRRRRCALFNEWVAAVGRFSKTPSRK